MTNRDDAPETMDDIRSKLLDLTRSNRLLNHKAGGARTLQIIDEIPGEVYRLVVEEEKTLQFLAREEAPRRLAEALAKQEEVGHDAEERHWDLPAEVEEGPAARHTDRKLQTTLAGEKLQTRLVAMARDAKASIDEQGVNTLYLTLGMVEWRAAGEKEGLSRAPLLFIPVQLERKNANSRHFLALHEDEILANPCLAELAKRDFGFALPAFDPEAEEEVAAYLARVAEEIAKVEGWRYVPEIHLGIFSFAKLMMWRDLDDARWPEDGKITAHALVRTLRNGPVEEAAREGGAASAAPPSEDQLDDRLTPADSFMVMDADSSQQAVVEAVKAGMSLVVEGPPGTGKSQTITNIIAESLAAGRTVLFVAEKAAALEVVKRRLEQAGLGDAVLPIHSKNTHKGTVMGELRRVLENPPGGAGAPAMEGAATLLGVRERLRAYHAEIHRPIGAMEISLYRAVGEALRHAGEAEAPCALAGEGGVLTWTKAQFDAAREQLETLGRRLVEVGDRATHPWRASRLERVPLETAQALPARGQALRQGIGEVARAGQTLAGLMEVAAPATTAAAERLAQAATALAGAPAMAAEAAERVDDRLIERLEAWIELVGRHGKERAAWAGVLLDAAEEARWEEWLARREKGGGFFAFLSRQWREDSRQLRAQTRGGQKLAREEELRVIRAVRVSAATREAIVAGGAEFAGVLGGAWNGWPADAGAIRAAADRLSAALKRGRDAGMAPGVLRRWLAAERTPLRQAGAELSAAVARLGESWRAFLSMAGAEDGHWIAGGVAQAGLAEVEQSVAAALAAMDRLPAWADMNAAERAAKAGPAAAFAAWATTAGVDAGRVGGAFARQFYRLWIDAALAQSPAVRDWRGDDYQALAARFRQLDRQWIDATRRRVKQLVDARRPDISGRTARASELGVIKAELRKKKRFMPLRKLLAEAGGAVQAIKPCLMMSPISVAQYLTPGAIAFDVVIFDEASQVEPADAFGAIARGRQLVLVGDEKQLPPTNFFARIEGDAAGDEEESSATDLESVLGLGAARLGASRQLRWHYRSRHASLIEFSNARFYDGHLRVFPSPHTDRSDYGLQFRFVEGAVYKRGAGRFNEVEAKAVAAAVMEHARRRPELSLGVGALNKPQAEAILDEIETLRREKGNEELEPFFDDKKAEPFFVKNLENIQGDEREVMFLSVAFGHDAAGKITGNFGALNGAGGWRRLNVFATRARRRCLIFSSIRADAIKLSAGAPRGVIALKEYLQVAEHGRLAEAPVPLRDHDSPFEADVCRALRDKGWEVHAQVGTAGFFIDLAVVDPKRPGRYLLGIECDGEVYHRTPTARDRDRIRQEILEGLGWNIHRLWSSDWFRRRPEALARLLAALAQAEQNGRQ